MGYQLFLTMHHFRYDLEAAFRKLDLALAIPNKILRIFCILVSFSINYLLFILSLDVFIENIRNGYIFTALAIRNNEELQHFAARFQTLAF